MSGRLFPPVFQEPEDVYSGLVVYSRRQYTETGRNAPVDPVPIYSPDAGSFSPSFTGSVPLAFRHAL
jgi:hypothetical protein